MAEVSIRNLCKKFGGTIAVSDFSLDIADGELVAFLGPSGCGKTTTLRMVAGFMQPTTGQIRIGKEDVTFTPPHKRNTGMVFQRYALFPHMTVSQNIAFGLEMHQVPKNDRAERINRVLDMVRMTTLADRYPRQLSGGQQQRVAIARALAIQPKVFLLDEPLSNLDANLRSEVREEIRNIQKQLGLTTIFVTHDQQEAMSISDRMAIMHDGRVQQLGAPQALYDRPANRFVADFLGKMNLFEGTLEGPDRFKTGSGEAVRIDRPVAGATHVGVRPERVEIRATGGQANALPGTVMSVVCLGPTMDIRFRLDGGDVISSTINNTSSEAAGEIAQAGRRGFACFSPPDCVLFAGGRT